MRCMVSRVGRCGEASGRGDSIARHLPACPLAVASRPLCRVAMRHCTGKKAKEKRESYRDNGISDHVLVGAMGGLGLGGSGVGLLGRHCVGWVWVVGLDGMRYSTRILLRDGRVS